MDNVGQLIIKNIIEDLGMLIQKIEEWNKLLSITKSQMILSTPKQSKDSTVPTSSFLCWLQAVKFCAKMLGVQRCS